jgi:hypothetical protein
MLASLGPDEEVAKAGSGDGHDVSHNGPALVNNSRGDRDACCTYGKENGAVARARIASEARSPLAERAPALTTNRNST